jgi:UDP-2,3-diacylglucosamine pyrophosphatase LpxH
VYLLFLGDIFQYDTTNRETGSGNRREAVGIPPEVLDAGFGLANDLVAKAKEIAPTTVRVVPGNHDPMLSRALMWQLNEQWSDSVNIEKNWDRRQYVQYQSNLIGLAHACKVKPSKLTDLMPREASDKWGETENRFYVYGHPHRPSIQQPDDTDIELLGIGTPCDSDEYEHSKG